MPVAYKQFKQGLFSTPTEVSGVQREIEVMSTVYGHPNLVKLLGVSGDPSTPIVGAGLLLELAERGTLRDLLQSEEAFPPEARFAVARDIADAMVHLHAETPMKPSIIHRDLKSLNILIFITEDGGSLAKVADFGISKGMSDNTMASTQTSGMGSIRWSAPECAKGKF